MIATRPAPCATRSCVIPTRGECPENPSPSPASLHIVAIRVLDGSATPNAEHPGVGDRIAGADAVQGCRRPNAHKEDDRPVGGLRTSDGDARTSVRMKLHVGPSQVRGFPTSQQGVSHHGSDRDVHRPPHDGGLGRLHAAGRVDPGYVGRVDNGSQARFPEPARLPRL